METILDRIIAEKQKEVLILKEQPVLKEVDRKHVSFIQKLKQTKTPRNPQQIHTQQLQT